MMYCWDHVSRHKVLIWSGRKMEIDLSSLERYNGILVSIESSEYISESFQVIALIQLYRIQHS